MEVQKVMDKEGLMMGDVDSIEGDEKQVTDDRGRYRTLKVQKMME